MAGDVHALRAECWNDTQSFIRLKKVISIVDLFIFTSLVLLTNVCEDL